MSSPLPLAGGLAGLTAVELVVARAPMTHALKLTVLLALALANAALVIAIGMGLRRAARPLRLAFVLSLVLPAAYALAIVAEAAVGTRGP